MEKYEKVLTLMQRKTDGILRMDDAELLALLGPELASYRVPMYISNIRKKANLDVKGIREGRTVVAYQLMAAAPKAPAAPTPLTPPTTPPAVEITPLTPEPPSEDPGTAQPPVSPDPPTSDPEPADDGWSI